LARWIRAVAEQESGRSLELDGKLLTPDFEADPAVAALAAQESGQLLVRAIDEAPRAAQDALARAFRGRLTHLRLIAWSRTDPRSRDAAWSPELVRLLRVTTVALPPLRERTDRILVAETMLGALAPDRSLSAAAQRVIERHTFPGNLTELEIVLQRARAHAGHRRVLEPEDLPTDLLQGGRDVDVTRRGAERAALEEALRAAKGNLSVAAKRLGVARTTLYRMIERHEDDALRVLLAGGARQRAPRTSG
jgi:transcriptional regulator of acetoin/glycerol metabolism